MSHTWLSVWCANSDFKVRVAAEASSTAMVDSVEAHELSSPR